jgi:very-short-patch-repair endonuclease
MNYHEIKLLSRKLRKNQTASEKQLWKRIRGRQLEGFKFLRQHPVIYDRNGNDLNIFIPDFYCPRARLAIEVDGGIHNTRQDQDRRREKMLTDMDITVLRLKNDELIDMESVLCKIKVKLKPVAPRRTTHPLPPPYA